jgi:hypothetical protein
MSRIQYRGLSYISEEKRFIRERYILVAAIVTMIILGVCGNCVVEKRKESISPPLIANKD